MDVIMRYQSRERKSQPHTRRKHSTLSELGKQTATITKRRASTEKLSSHRENASKATSLPSLGVHVNPQAFTRSRQSVSKITRSIPRLHAKETASRRARASATRLLMALPLVEVSTRPKVHDIHPCDIMFTESSHFGTKLLVTFLRNANGPHFSIVFISFCFCCLLRKHIKIFQ